MKIQIVQLEAHDDVISTRDKMGWGQTSRILLVWPVKGQILDRTLDLVLLQRHSHTLGAQLALVTRDDVVCDQAKQLGIPTFSSLREAQSARRGSARQRIRRGRTVRRLRLRKPKPLAEILARREQVYPRPGGRLSHPVVQMGAFAVGVLAFLVLLVAVIPGAVIDLEPRQEIQSVTFPITASPDFTVPRLTGDVPAEWIKVVVEARGAAVSTGQVPVPEKPASGKVTFTNLTTQSLEIPKGTIVRTQGSEAMRFATTQTARVNTQASSSQEVSVQALSPGTQGNVAAGAIQSIEGTLSLKLSVTNPKAMRGGTSELVRGPSAEDRQELFKTLSTTLQETAKEELTSAASDGISAGTYPILPSLKLHQVLEQRFQPEDENAPAEQLELTLRLEFDVLVVAEQDLQAVAIPILAAELPEGYTALPGSLQISPIEIPTMLGEQSAQWKVQASQSLQVNISRDEVIQVAGGQPAAEAQARLFSQLPLAQAPTIRVSPSWWPLLPFAPFRIEVN